LKRRSILPGGDGGGAQRASSQYLNISKSDLEDDQEKRPASLLHTSTPFSSPVKDTSLYSNNNNNNNNSVYSSLRENNNSSGGNHPQSPRDAAVNSCSFSRGDIAATYSSFRDSPLQRDVRRQLKFQDGGGGGATSANRLVRNVCGTFAFCCQKTQKTLFFIFPHTNIEFELFLFYSCLYNVFVFALHLYSN
jgi:hypothetical protein